VLVGLRVQLKHGLSGTKEKPTSVPMRAYCRLFRSHGVSSAGGGLKPRV